MNAYQFRPFLFGSFSLHSQSESFFSGAKRDVLEFCPFVRTDLEAKFLQLVVRKVRKTRCRATEISSGTSQTTFPTFVISLMLPFMLLAKISPTLVLPCILPLMLFILILPISLVTMMSVSSGT